MSLRATRNVSAGRTLRTPGLYPSRFVPWVFFQHGQLFWFQQECMLIDIAKNSEVYHLHLAQKVLSKMATMGVNNAFHVNIVMQVHFHFSTS